MKVRDVLEDRRDDLTGSTITAHDRERLLTELPSLARDIGWLADLMTDFNLAGTTFQLDEECDESGVGVELKWMSAAQIIDEANNAYPGRIVVSLGYLPIGCCLLGSGDPYFLRAATRQLVRVPHDAILNNRIAESSIEVVSESLETFFKSATIE